MKAALAKILPFQGAVLDTGSSHEAPGGLEPLGGFMSFALTR